MGPIRKVLIVDDDLEICRLIARVLKSDEVHTTICNSGAEATELLNGQKFDLVLLDLGLPDCHGLEVLEKFSHVDGTRFLIITADDTPKNIMQALRQQAYGYLRKPFDHHELAELAHEALNAPVLPPIDVISAKPEWLELSVPCSRNAAERVDAFMRSLANLPEELEQVCQCFRELLMNAVEWGGELDPNRRVRIAYLRTPRMLQYRIADPGPGFKFEDLEHAAVGHEAQQDLVSHTAVRAERGLRGGGFGLLMVKAFSDELIYNEKQNEVVFIKYLEDRTEDGKPEAAVGQD